ncbi:MAG: TIGR02449 family protein [Aquisalimonadaceae bacterium]
MNDVDARKLREDIQQLEQRVERLVDLCARLREENRVLRHSQDTLSAERAGLLEKNEMARSRIEAMISRLKAMEQH